MAGDDIAFLSATDALRLFRTRELSPVELLEALIRRAETVEPRINAFSGQRVDLARAEARKAESRYAHPSASPRPLEGIPVALKNEHTMVGDSTTQGSTLLRGSIDTANAPVTDRLLDAGAIIHAKTNVPEFCCALFTRTREYGVTRNPWNLQVTCGGSSGGSGAALAAGMTTLAAGSDIGGSIRIPASQCGVVGLKPSYGRVPEAVFEFAMNTYNHNGPMARTVADCVLMFNVLNGAHHADPATVVPRIEVSTEPLDLRGLSVALSIGLDYFSPEPAVAANTRAIAQMLEALGARVEEVNLGWDAGVAGAAADGLLFPMGRLLAGLVGERRALANDYTLQFIDAGMATPPERYLAHFHTMGALDRALQRVLADHDVLLCPTMADTSIPAEGGADPLHDLWTKAMTYPFNMLSRHPVLSIPSGFAPNGVPTGVQLVGRRFADETVLRLGMSLEAALQWNRVRPAA